MANDLFGQWQEWINRPENRSGVMQFGINLLQPKPVGQTTIGHAAGSIGAGAEARDRSLLGQSEAEKVGRKLDIEQQEADALQGYYNQRGGLSMSGLLAEQNRRRNWVANLAGAIAEDILLPETSPYYGKTKPEVMEMLLNDPQERARLERLYNSGQGFGAGVGAAGPATSPGKPTLSQKIKGREAAWENLVARAKQGDAAAMQDIQNIKNNVSDPQTVDVMLAQ